MKIESLRAEARKREQLLQIPPATGADFLLLVNANSNIETGNVPGRMIFGVQTTEMKHESRKAQEASVFGSQVALAKGPPLGSYRLANRERAGIKFRDANGSIHLVVVTRPAAHDFPS